MGRDKSLFNPIWKPLAEFQELSWRLARLKSVMGKLTPVAVDDKSLLKRLRAEYDTAFRNWSAQVRVLQSVSAGDPPDSGAVAEARRWADEAAAIYREKRNVFLRHLIASRSREAVSPGMRASEMASVPQGIETDLRDRTPQVRRLARQIWEEAGRPEGTAEHDWFKAEEILQSRR